MTGVNFTTFSQKPELHALITGHFTLTHTSVNLTLTKSTYTSCMTHARPFLLLNFGM